MRHFNLKQCPSNTATLLGLQSARAIYQFDHYKSNKRVPYHLTIYLNKIDDEIQHTLEQGVIVGEGVNVARDFSYMPPNLLTPKVFADEITQHFEDRAVQIDIKMAHNCCQKALVCYTQ